MQNFIKFSLILIVSYILQTHGYEIPKPTLELLSPKGFRISIPSEPNIVFFAFHGSINQPIRGVETGDFHGESSQPINNNFVYENLKEFLIPGDTLYYWIHVQHKDVVYRLMDQSILVPTDPTGNQNFVQPISTTTVKPSFFFVFGQPPSSSSNDFSQQFYNPQSIFQPTTGSIFSNFGSGSMFTLPTLAPTNPPIITRRPTTKYPIINEPIYNKQDCIKSETIVHGQQVCTGELIFEDTFNTLNWTKWQREIKMPLDTEDAEFVSFQDRTENCYITDGNLYIIPTLLTDLNGYNQDNSIRSGEIDFGSKCTGIVDSDIECRRKAGIFRILPPIVSAKIRTKNTFSFLYGRVEIRAKLPKGDWLFPQILLEPLTNNYGITGFASGQMRVAYNHGNEILETREGKNIAGNQLFGGVVLSTGAKYRDIWFKNRSWSNHLGRDFHVYTLTWTTQTITLSIDGNEYASLRGGFKQIYYTHNITHAQKWENGGFMAPFDKEFYLSLGVSVGGISDFPDRCVTGPSRKQKPWFNSDPKAELRFWNDRSNWYDTWDQTNSGMIVDYIKVWAL